MRFHEKIKTVSFCRRELLIEIKKWIDLVAFQKVWRQGNSHNGTTAGNKYDISKVHVGVGTYGEIKVIGFDNPDEQLIIGNFCSIAGDVTFLLGGEHKTDLITTFPYRHHMMNSEDGVTPTKGPIIVEDDVWICHGATILSGVTIGKGAIIGAKAVISKDVPAYAVVVNNNEIKRKRFKDDIVEELLKVNLIDIERLDLKKKEYLMSNPVNQANVKEIVTWFSETDTNHSER